MSPPQIAGITRMSHYARLNSGFLVLRFTSRSMIYPEWTFVKGIVIYLDSVFFTNGYTVTPDSFLYWIGFASLSKVRWLCMSSFLSFGSAVLIYLSVVSPVPHSAHSCSFIVSLKCQYLYLVPLFPFSCPRLLSFNINLRINLMTSTK
jgi:hypothetical protein